MDQPSILVVNAGSSSFKFALFRAGAELDRFLTGRVERIGQPDALLRIVYPADEHLAAQNLMIQDHAAAVPYLLEQLVRLDIRIVAVGHRIVHGGVRFREPQTLTDEVIEELNRLCALSPEHMPAALSVIAALRRAYPQVPHIACFDTAFHCELPPEAARLPIPRRYGEKGIRRFGFHGLSYAYLMEELAHVAGPEAVAGRVVLAHLGHGASMAAVRAGHCVDTTMALTPASGLVMATRTGDLDPGLGAYLSRTEGMAPERFYRMTHAESGLLGVSETSGDVRDLLSAEAFDVRAAEALALFCYQSKKWIGALAAALGGIDTLVFSGGIGENAAPIRARICEGLAFLGIALDHEANLKNAAILSSSDSRVVVRMLRTDEELYIARTVNRLLLGGPP